MIQPSSDAIAAARPALERYRQGWAFGAGLPTDAAVPDRQAGAGYVARYDPLRHAIAAGEARAIVSLGVDPGSFFCGGLAMHLARLAAARPEVAVGFVHVPPDRACGPVAAENPALLSREANLALGLAVVGRSLGLLAAGAGPDPMVLLTGFGPFASTHDNPTRALLLAGEEAHLAHLDAIVAGGFGAARRCEAIAAHGRVIGARYAAAGRTVTVMVGGLALAPTVEAAIEGRYHADKTPVRAQLAALFALAGGRPDIVIGLGVDSQQQRAEAGMVPRFKVETQSRGFRHGGVEDEEFADEPVGLTELGTLWLAACGWPSSGL